MNLTNLSQVAKLNYVYIFILAILSFCYNFTACFFFTQEKPLQKSLQRGEDMQLDQLLSTLNAVAEHCLPSLLKTLFAWYDRQIPHKTRKPKSNKANKDVLSERRDVSYYSRFVLFKITNLNIYQLCGFEINLQYVCKLVG